MSQGRFSLLNIFYPIETVLKLAFIVMAPFNLPYTLLLAFVASVIGLIRVVKRPQFSKQYLGKVLMNNHGQNILYSSFGAIGFVNYLYYAPIVLFFLYGIIEFLRLKLPNLAFNRYGDLIRHNKWWVYEGKCRMEIFFFLYLVFTLPFDLMGRGLKCFIMGQFLFIKYRINQEFTHSCSMMNTWVEQKTEKIGFVNTLYKKCAGWVYGYATRELSQNPAPQQPQQPQN